MDSPGCCESREGLPKLAKGPLAAAFDTGQYSVRTTRRIVRYCAALTFLSDAFGAISYKSHAVVFRAAAVKAESTRTGWYASRIGGQQIERAQYAFGHAAPHRQHVHVG
jgi:hypothetical protein